MPTISKAHLKLILDNAITSGEKTLGDGWIVHIVGERFRTVAEGAAFDDFCKLLADLGFTITD